VILASYHIIIILYCFKVFIKSITTIITVYKLIFAGNLRLFIFNRFVCEVTVRGGLPKRLYAVATVRNPKNLFSSSVKDHTHHNLSRSY